MLPVSILVCVMGPPPIPDSVDELIDRALIDGDATRSVTDAHTIPGV